MCIFKIRVRNNFLSFPTVRQPRCGIQGSRKIPEDFSEPSIFPLKAFLRCQDMTNKCVQVEVEEAKYMAEARIPVSEAVFDGTKIHWSYLCSGLFPLHLLLTCVEWKKRRPIPTSQDTFYT